METMTVLPAYHVGAEIRRILRVVPPPAEVLLRVRGRAYDPARPSTFFHMRAVDRLGRIRGRGLPPGAEVWGRVVMVAEFIEPCERPRRTLEVNGRRRSGTIPRAIRVIGHDNLIAGKVLRIFPDEGFLLDAGIPVHVSAPGFAPSFYPEGEFVEFILRRTPEFLLA